MQSGTTFMGETNSPISAPVEPRRFSATHLIAAVVGTMFFCGVILSSSSPCASKPVRVEQPAKAQIAAVPDVVAVAPKAAADVPRAAAAVPEEAAAALNKVVDAPSGLAAALGVKAIPALAAEPSNECAYKGDELCYGPLKKAGSVFRQCSKGLKASACECYVFDGKDMVSSLKSKLIKNFLCKCDYKMNEAGASIWGMKLSCAAA